MDRKIKVPAGSPCKFAKATSVSGFVRSDGSVQRNKRALIGESNASPVGNRSGHRSNRTRQDPCHTSSIYELQRLRTYQRLKTPFSGHTFCRQKATKAYAALEDWYFI